ncbi:MAG: ExeA family protein [Pirellulales bacterium]
MYQQFYQLSKNPFPASPNPSNYFATEGTEQARHTVVRSAERGEGPSLLIGSPGIGKSILCQTAAHDLRSEFHVVSLNCGRICSRRTLLQAILYELNQSYRGMDEGELRLSLIDFLSSSTNTQAALLIVDEADSLPLSLLDELRLLTNIVRDGKPQINLLLAGGLALEERFASPRLESFNQRIAKRCYLDSFTREESIRYVEFQLDTAGADHPIFDESALVTIHKTTDGIPRLINQLCDHTLVLASQGGHSQISANEVSEAWADLQQLPSPVWEDQPETQNSSSTDSSDMLEFGSLLDDDQSETSSISFAPLVPESTVAEEQSQPAPLDTREDLKTTTQNPVHHLKIAMSDEELESASAFENAKDPFQESFEEVEVILDQYASLEDQRIPSSQKVSSIEGIELAAMLQSNSVIVESREPQIYRASPAADVVMPSLESEEDLSNDALVLQNLNDQFGSITVDQQPVVAIQRSDDKDLLIIDEDEPATEAPKVSSVKARKQDYHQLFTNLRKELA